MAKQPKRVRLTPRALTADEAKGGWLVALECTPAITARFLCASWADAVMVKESTMGRMIELSLNVDLHVDMSNEPNVQKCIITRSLVADDGSMIDPGSWVYVVPSERAGDARVYGSRDVIARVDGRLVVASKKTPASYTITPCNPLEA